MLLLKSEPSFCLGFFCMESALDNCYQVEEKSDLGPHPEVVCSSQASGDLIRAEKHLESPKHCYECPPYVEDTKKRLQTNMISVPVQNADFLHLL